VAAIMGGTLLLKSAPASWRALVCGAGLTLAAAGLARGAAAQTDEEQQPTYPTTAFAEGAKSAAVTAGDVTATVTMARRPDVDPTNEVPVLTVTVGGKAVLEAVGVASGLEFPAAEASIAEIDPDNHHPEVYFTSYSGGAHCCNTVIVAEEQGDHWVSVPIGEFDGDGEYLNDLDGDGLADISTVDNRFLYQFDCYACSAAPLIIMTVRNGAMVDVTTEPRYLPAHRDWLKQIEDNVDPAERWTSPGYLAGWVAEKIRIGEGPDSLKELTAHWNLAKDEAQEVCLTGGEPEDCPKKQRATLKFPDRLKLFLDQKGYTF
jgi:hypothetical protein